MQEESGERADRRGHEGKAQLELSVCMVEGMSRGDVVEEYMEA